MPVRARGTQRRAHIAGSVPTLYCSLSLSLFRILFCLSLNYIRTYALFLSLILYLPQSFRMLVLLLLLLLAFGLSQANGFVRVSHFLPCVKVRQNSVHVSVPVKATKQQ